MKVHRMRGLILKGLKVLVVVHNCGNGSIVRSLSKRRILTTQNYLPSHNLLPITRVLPCIDWHHMPKNLPG